MNKWSKMAVSSLVAFTVLTPGLASAEDMKAMVDYSKVQHVMKDGVDLVPLREIAESLGYQVAWNNDEQSATLVAGGMKNGNMGDMSMSSNPMGVNSMDTSMAYTVKTKINMPEVWVGMSEKMLSYAPVIINDRTYVTKDFINEYLAKQKMMK